MDIKHYEISLNGSNPNNLETIKDILESNAHLFDKHLLADYGGDTRYSVMDGSFEVTEIGEEFFNFEAAINFFAGCSDLNDSSAVDGQLPYEVRNGSIHIEVDETVWNVNN